MHNDEIKQSLAFALLAHPEFKALMSKESLDKLAKTLREQYPKIDHETFGAMVFVDNLMNDLQAFIKDYK